MADERFWSKVDASGVCWEWTGAKNPDGYGNVTRQGKTLKAHRYAYSLLVEPIPADMEADHRCFNRACVNPDHLDIVDHETNSRRARRARAGSATYCGKGHEYSDDNSYVWDGRPNGNRKCRKCSAQAQREYRARKKLESVS